MASWQGSVAPPKRVTRRCRRAAAAPWVHRRRWRRPRHTVAPQARRAVGTASRRCGRPLPPQRHQLHSPLRGMPKRGRNLRTRRTWGVRRRPRTGASRRRRCGSNASSSPSANCNAGRAHLLRRAPCLSQRCRRREALHARGTAAAPDERTRSVPRRWPATPRPTGVTKPLWNPAPSPQLPEALLGPLNFQWRRRHPGSASCQHSRRPRRLEVAEPPSCKPHLCLGCASSRTTSPRPSPMCGGS
mmetsp:Transcript_13988/g.38222  ORF Transcript_13988/g.38222 Transcript_13988/m.38222 type:complete len:244 (+) Transcript_13988:601-1332(+)